jgi:hypothetical protein
LAKPLRKIDTTWIEPRFDAEIAYAEITDDGMVRHPVFKLLATRAAASISLNAFRPSEK